METSVQTATRLIGALEEMMGREAMYLAGDHFERVDRTRARIDPLVRHLAGLAAEPGVAALRARVAALVERCALQSKQLDARMRELADELGRAGRAHHHAGKLGPAYALNSTAAAPRFSAAG